ncbi:hypothetical protein [Phragmitibacter flavus]|nr:hypothetical protein [Phragmitibacter flavus]
MSSIATFYLIPIHKKDSYATAQASETIITQKPRLFGLLGSQSVETPGRPLWKFLGEQADAQHDFPHSGFAMVDYLLAYVLTEVPDALQQRFGDATSKDAHYFTLDHQLAQDLLGHLESHTPDDTTLAELSSEQGHDRAAYGALPGETHRIRCDWLRAVSPSQFGVLHVTF